MADGGFVHVAADPAAAHRCTPPERDVFMRPPPPPPSAADPHPSPRPASKVGTTPDAPVGSVWACDCGIAWIVAWDDGHRAYGYSVAHAYWRRATWWERRRARREAAR